jgi:adiponectin receptor
MINQTFSLIKSSANNNINDFTISLSDYFDIISEKLKKMQEEIITLMEMEMENLSFIQKPKSPLKRWPLFIMLLSAILCLSFSALFHLLGTMNKTTFKILSRFDYGGISLLIAGSCYPPYYYFFNCDFFYRIFYLTFISVFSLIVFFLSLTSKFHLPINRTLRGSLFLSLGLSAGIPIIHLALMGNSVKGFDGSPRLLFWYLGGISYVIGALMYINRIPEKLMPGKFDFFGSSHQIFHCFVILGVVFHYIGCLDAFYYRFDNECKF